MKSVARVEEALKVARDRSSEMPEYAIYASCVAQLEYLLATLKGNVPMDRPKIRSIMVGHYGVREFEESDPEFSEVLKEAQYIALQIGKGLKVD